MSRQVFADAEPAAGVDWRVRHLEVEVRRLQAAIRLLSDALDPVRAEAVARVIEGHEPGIRSGAQPR
jgi:hypothetical protein